MLMMKMMVLSFNRYIILLILIHYTYTKPHLETVSRRDTEHFIDDPDRHDIEFDHNAFLGEETAKEFSQLTPNESEEKLKIIIRKIDKDNDEKITEYELKSWIEYVASKSKQNSTDRQWNDINPTNQSSIKWTEYLIKTYGPEEERLKDTATSESYKKAVQHDRRRWVAADLDKDDSLNKTEFTDFVHPEDRPNMRDAVIDELLEYVDKDNDGYVSEKEYLVDLARAYQSTPFDENEPEAEWVERERSQFRRFRDTNQDGRMDRAEVGEWIMPSNYDPIDAETKHLFYHADTNKDGLLTEAEIIAKRDTFVSSQATNYGNALKQHEEL
ncbi:unnamed protein product [Schistosoma guineensis]|nr:unnamed protein product [Schistosoma bovis]CAH8517072.1 unnamed protein product [Schistosoma guineensis]